MIKPALSDRALTGRMLELYNAIKEDGWISGSYATWMASSSTGASTPSDIDVFCKAESGGHARMCAALGALGFAVVGQSVFSTTYFDTHGEVPLLIQVVQPVPISISDHDPEGAAIYEVRRYGDTPEALVKNFDLSVAQAVVVSPTEVWVSYNWQRGETYHSLYVTDVLTPLNTVQRLIKYGKRGYTVDSQEILKLFSAWELMSDTEREVQFYL